VKIPMEEAVEQLLDAYREWLEDSPDNMANAWLEHFEQVAEVKDTGDDPPDLFLEVEE